MQPNFPSLLLSPSRCTAALRPRGDWTAITPARLAIRQTRGPGRDTPTGFPMAGLGWAGRGEGGRDGAGWVPEAWASRRAGRPARRMGTRRDGARRGSTHQILHSGTLEELLRRFQLQPICQEKWGGAGVRGATPSPTPVTSARPPAPSPTRRHGLLEDGYELHGGGDGGGDSSQDDGPASRAAAPTGDGGWGSGGKGGWGGGWGSPQAHSPAASGQALRLPFLPTLLPSALLMC